VGVGRVVVGVVVVVVAAVGSWDVGDGRRLRTKGVDVMSEKVRCSEMTIGGEDLSAAWLVFGEFGESWEYLGTAECVDDARYLGECWRHECRDVAFPDVGDVVSWHDPAIAMVQRDRVALRRFFRLVPGLVVDGWGGHGMLGADLVRVTS